jgi:hypothetical protein
MRGPSVMLRPPDFIWIESGQAGLLTTTEVPDTWPCTDVLPGVLTDVIAWPAFVGSGATPGL